MAIGCLCVGYECVSHRHHAGLLIFFALRRMIESRGCASVETAAVNCALERLGKVYLVLGDALHIPEELLLLLTHVFLFDVVRPTELL